MGISGNRTFVRVLVPGVLALAVAGCGGGDDATSDTLPTAAPTSTTEPELVEPARDFSGSRFAVVAHRGASAEAPEHTFAAYDLAVEQGADYLEQDLHLTADGVLVVIHDPALDRTATGPEDLCTGLVRQRTAADLEACEVGSWFDDAFAGEPIPTMAQVFHRYGSTVRYYIEIKSPEAQPGIEEALLALLDEVDVEAIDAELPPVVIQSFSPEALRRIHEARPDLPLVQLISPVTGPEVDAVGLDEIATYAVAVGPSKVLVDEALVAAAHERCLDVHPYTVDDPDEMADLLDLGVGAMFSNEPATLRAASADRTSPELCPAPAAAVGG